MRRVENGDEIQITVAGRLAARLCHRLRVDGRDGSTSLTCSLADPIRTGNAIVTWLISP